MTKNLRKSALISLIAIFAVLSVLCAVFALTSDTEKARASDETGFVVVGGIINRYTTFAKAWSDSIDAGNAIITMYEDATVSETLTIAEGKTILLNLNGHELKFTGTSGSVFSVSGTFTLKDEENTTLSHEITSPVTSEKVTIEGGLITGGGKATDMGGDTDGGAVYVNIGGTFNMNGGTLAGNTVTGAGGAVSNDGTFKMTGGTISDNTAATYGGGVRNGMTFNMSGDAKIKNNEATSATAGEGGGGVCNFGTFTMEGNAVISGNSARDGGGVFNKDVFTMEGGTIEGNRAKNYTGGGVRNDKTFNMSGDAKIKNNEAKTDDDYSAGEGGGVFNNGTGTFNMAGNAEISGNSSRNGGGVNNAGTFTMSGGTIEGNTAASMGGGVYIFRKNFTMSGFSSISGNHAGSGGGVCFDSGTFKVSGAVNITGNKNSDDKNDNAYLYEAITVEGPLTDGEQKAQIGLSEQSRAYVATAHYSDNHPDESPYNYFISDRKNGCLALANNEVNVYTSHVYGFAPKSCTTCGYIPEAYCGDVGVEICGNFSDVWEREDVTIVYLNKDIEIAETLVVPSGETKRLSLNNHVLTYTGASGSAIRVEGTFELLADSTSNLDEKTFKDPNTNTDVKVKGGLLTGGKGYGESKKGGGVFVANGGSFTMFAGNIAGNTGDFGGGVRVDDNGSFIMQGGSICYNKAEKDGGGLCVCNAKKISLEGGKINNNSAGAGGGVYFEGASTTTDFEGFSVTKTVIENNAAVTVANMDYSGAGGGIYIDGAVVEITGGREEVQYITVYGKIKQNTATVRGGGVFVDSEATLKVGGMAIISDNKVDGNFNNVYNDNGGTITVSSLLETEQVLGGDSRPIACIYLNNGTVNGYTQDDSPWQFFYSDDSTKCAKLGDNGTVTLETHDYQKTFDETAQKYKVTCSNCGNSKMIYYLRVGSEVIISGSRIAAVSGSSGGQFAVSITDEPSWNGNKSQITKVTIRDGVTPMSTAAWFKGCRNLETVDLSGLSSTYLTDMSYMFSGCSVLSSIVFPNGFTAEQVTDMSYLFNGCSALTTLDLSGFNTSLVNNMANMFNGCTALATLDISGFNTSFVTDMSHMFHNCWTLKTDKFKLPTSFDTANVTNMAQMFFGCETLTALDFPNDFSTVNVKNMMGMFNGCTALTTVDLSGFNTANVENMQGMFYVCKALVSNKSNPLVFPSTFDTANVTNMKNMFAGCWMLENLNLSGFDTTNVTDMNNMFAYCIKLNTLDLSSFNTASVTDMSYMFSGCSVLTALDLSSFNTVSVTNATNMFYECSALYEIIAPQTIGTVALPLPCKFWDGTVVDGTVVGDVNPISAEQAGKTLYRHAEHSYGDWQSATAATCTTAGTIAHKDCSVCGKHFNEIGGEIGSIVDSTAPALGHDFAHEFTVDIEPSCTDSGSKSKHCSRCSEKKEVTETPALGHSYGEPTYFWNGNECIATRICSRTVAHEESETVTATSVTVAPTCTAGGSTTLTATFTNSAFATQTKVSTTPALGHSFGTPTYDWSSDNTACTATRVCSRDANHVETETVTTTSDVTAPTCTADGYTTFTATFTNTAFATQTTWTNHTAATGHSYGEWQTVTAPTCMAEGTKKRVCSVCSHEESQTIAVDPSAHSWDEGTVTTAPTCTDTGVKRFVCAHNSAHIKDEPVAATGHNYGEWQILSEATCSAEGSKKRVCSVCEHEETATIAINPDAHDYGEWTVTRPSTLTEFGEEQRVCSRNHEHIDTRQLPKRVAELSKPDENGGATDEVVVSQENGLPSGVELFVTRIAEENYAHYQTVAAAVNGVVGFVYDVTLKSGGVTVQPDGTLTIKLRIPENLVNKQFKLFHMHDGTATDKNYTVEGSYAVLTTDELSEFIFVGAKAAEPAPSPDGDGDGLSAGAVAGITIAVILAVLVAAYVACYFALYRKGILSGKVFDVIYVPLNALFKKNNEE